MRPIATEVARSAICVLASRWALQKRLNRSRCHLGADSCDPGKHVLDEDAHWHHLANTIKRSMREAMRPYVHTVTQERVNTGWAKKLHTKLTAIILSNLNRLTSLPHVKFVATLPSLYFIVNRLFSGISVLQGSVAICARCCGTHNDHFTANLLENLSVQEF